MAISHDAQTRFPVTDTTTSDSTTGDRTFDHAGSASATGAVVVIQSSAAAATVTGVLYGGVAMTLAPALTVNTTEAGSVEVYSLTDQASFPTGTQTVTLQGCTAAAKFATCSTVLCSVGSRSKVNASAKQDTTTSANPSINVVTSATTMLYGGVSGGEAAPTGYVPATGYTTQFSFDAGSRSMRSQRRTSEVAAGTVAFGFTTVSNNWCLAAVALEEYTPGGAPARPKSINYQAAVNRSYTW